MKIDPIWTDLLFKAKPLLPGSAQIEEPTQLVTLESLSADQRINQIDIPTDIAMLRLVYCAGVLILLSFESEPVQFPGYDKVRDKLRNNSWHCVECPPGEGLARFCEILASTRFLAPPGTGFQRDVWNALLGLASGQRTTYRELAIQHSSAAYARAVGSAIAQNSIALVIPCHRVVPASGGVGQYRWGVPLKKALLQSEQDALR